MYITTILIKPNQLRIKYIFNFLTCLVNSWMAFSCLFLALNKPGIIWTARAHIGGSTQSIQPHRDLCTKKKKIIKFFWVLIKPYKSDFISYLNGAAVKTATWMTICPRSFHYTFSTTLTPNHDWKRVYLFIYFFFFFFLIF